MRTEQTNYMQKAERMAYMMDLEEQAARATKSVWQTEVSETRLANLRKEAETILKEWRISLKIIDAEVYKASKQREQICYVDSIFYLFAWGDKKITEDEYLFRKGQQEKIEKILKGLQETQDALLEAIAYLEEYLHPSQEGNASQADDVPFASNFGIIAQTPKESLLKMLLRKQGQNMRTAFLNGVDKSSEDDLIQSMTDNKCWSLLEEAIKAEGLDEDENPDVEALWTLYNEGNFDAVVNEVKECFLNE